VESEPPDRRDKPTEGVVAAGREVPDIVPATPDRWEDLVRLFGPTGAYSNCWCTWFVLTASRFDEATPKARKSILRNLVSAGEEPGLLAYDDGDPVGWCAVGPRERYRRMMSPRSTVYRPLDDRPGWVINCFFIAKHARRRGVATALLRAAADYAFDHGAERIDAYPLPASGRDAGELFVGTEAMFAAAGFNRIAEMRGRPVMRIEPKG
jgi:GNAT superfamily N-acetyltransferase